MFDIQQIEFLLEQRIETLTEEQLVFLVENRISFLKNQHQGKIVPEHDPVSKKYSSDQIIDKIAKDVDPDTVTHGNTEWLVNRYKSGEFTLKDAKKINADVSKFHAIKGTLESKDLKSYKSLQHMRDAISTQTSKHRDDQQKADQNAVKPMPVVFTATHTDSNGKDHHIEGYKVPSKATSIYNYGPNGKVCQARWCTAAAGANNRFVGYKGGKYTLHLPNETYIQVNHQSNQLKNKQNYDINVNDKEYYPYKKIISDFVNKTHELEFGKDSTEHMGLKTKYSIIANDNTDIVNHLMNRHRTHVDEFEKAGDKYTTIYGARDSFNLLVSALHSHKISESDFESLKSFKHLTKRYYDNNVAVSDLTRYAKENQNLTPPQIDHLIDGDIYPIKHPNLSDDQKHRIISKYANSNSHEAATNIAADMHDLNEDHIAKLHAIHPIATLSSLSRNLNTNIPYAYQEKIADMPELTSNLAIHPSIHPDIARSLIGKTKDGETIRNLIANPHVHIDTVQAVLDHYKIQHLNTGDLFEREDFKPEHASKFLDQFIAGTHATQHDNHMFIQSPKLSLNDLHKLIDATGTKYIRHIIRNPRSKSDIINKFIDHPEFAKDLRDNSHELLSSNNLKSGHIDKLISKFGVGGAKFHILNTDNHEHTTSEHLTHIMNAPDTHITDKHKILFHPNVQLSHFNQVKDDVRFHGAISNSENAPPSILHTLATSPMDHVRLNVAKNKNTEKRTFEILKTDANEDIAKLAQKKVK